MQLLPSNRANINFCRKNGFTPLYIACLKGHNRTVKILINIGLIFATSEYDNIVELLLRYGAEINLCHKKGCTPLIDACLNGHISTVQLLLSSGAKVNLCLDNGASPFSLACLHGHDDIVQFLLRNAADIYLCLESGACPLYEACQEGHDNTVQLLLKYGADFDTCKKKTEPVLFM